MDIQLHKSYKVLLMGDSCLDVYHFGTCDRISAEAPVPIMREKYIKTQEGMAGNVKNNLEPFGVTVDFITNEQLIKKHRYIDVKTKAHLLRVDEGEDELLPPIIQKIEKKKYDALVISDYNKGLLPFEMCRSITQDFHDVPVFVDSKKRDLGCFHKSVLKVNECEYQHSINVCPTSEIIVTRGDKGASFKGKNFSTKKIVVHDVCGAGDVFLASLVYNFLETRSLERAIIYANKLASLSVTKFGTYVITTKEINEICI